MKLNLSKTWASVALVAMGVSGAFASGPTTQKTAPAAKMAPKAADSQASMRAEARISEAQARTIAMKKAPGGKVESSELEREHGALVYSFDIRNTKGTITEVLVNAVNGAIVAVEYENKAKEKAEKKQEAKEKAVPVKKN